MSLKEEARDEIHFNQLRCGVGKLIDAHPGLADELAEAFADPDLPGSAIARALQKRFGSSLPKDQTVNRHRKQECSCES